MRRLTKRQIAIFDLDGVISQNPEEALSGLIVGHNTWTEHWRDVYGAKLNDEVIAIIHSLLKTEWLVVILTARPSRYAMETMKLLTDRVGLHRGFMWVGDAVHQSFDDAFAPQEVAGGIVLKMMDTVGIPTSSGAWKAEVIRGMLEAGLNVKFMMEDYKANAEEIRKLVPVFLYERVK